MVSAVIAFAVVAGLMTLVPGIDTALVLRTAIVQGRGPAFAAGAGISAGVLIWGVAAALGVSALLAASRLAFDVLRWAGAAYVAWLGVSLIWRSLRGGTVDLTAGPVRPDTAWTGFRRGLLTNLLNPKIGVFYVAVLPQFLPEGVPAGLAGAALALVHVVEGMAWFTVLILGAHLLRDFLGRRGVQQWIDRITGGVLIGFGIRLALSRA